ncbi:hypothetical protein QOZ80_7AG0559260 [Eleusine coracana subsp. coracana]|nr:hypothetical protein QOZ80_7AG0559260 [Eleusine coracana subsp. coracana]
MLGVIRNVTGEDHANIVRFVPTCSAPPGRAAALSAAAGGQSLPATAASSSERGPSCPASAAPSLSEWWVLLLHGRESHRLLCTELVEPDQAKGRSPIPSRRRSVAPHSGAPNHPPPNPRSARRREGSDGAPCLSGRRRIVEEILLRIPPHDPARLVRASLVCKRWCRLVFGPGFRRRFRERHRRAPELGILRNFCKKGHLATTHFVPTCSFRPRPGVADLHGWQAIDSHHGRVLLRRLPRRFEDFDDLALAVWDPVTDKRRELPLLPFEGLRDWRVTVVCAAAAGECDHLNCHRGPFLVVVLGTYSTKVSTFGYSSDSAAWSEPTTFPHQVYLRKGLGLGGAVVGNALYYVFHGDYISGILKYDLATRGMTSIDLPPVPLSPTGYTQVMTAEGGELGCAACNGTLLHLWSREAGPGGEMGWTRSKVIELEMLIPTGRLIDELDVVGSADGGGVLYVGTNRGYYCADLKSGRFRKLPGIRGDDDDIVPFLSFYTLALGVAATNEGATASASNA